jgi:N-acetylmuramoyl-L-alanine amidase
MIKRMLSIVLIIAGTTTLLISWKTHTTVSSANESRRPVIQGERYYNIEETKEELVLSSMEEDITYTVGEREVVGLTVSKLKVEKKEPEPLYDFTDEEIAILERITEAECEGKDVDSKKNVASVIINRVNSDNFPSTVEKVVFQKKPSIQFAPTEDKRYYKVEITQETKDAVKTVLHDGVTTEATYFTNMDNVTSPKLKRWFKNSLEFLFKDDANHSFFIEKDGD